ncbi:hypothetical protein [Actinoplanes sp. GCM10030250]|uniref:hypothetical protein n=1 Tax=Actinoplanes sp. GCM10030250 TaxID=3273376 RepID=UPI003607DCBD
MAATGDSIGQRWHFVPLGDESFAVRASSYGDCYSLDTHKNGWLPDQRKTYLAESRRRWRTILHPLTDADGLSMIVLPVDDTACPSKVFVIEPAQPVIGSDDQPWGDGILVYTVDATVESGECPVVVIPRVESYSETYGDLYEAPYREGDVAEVSEGRARLTVAVTRRLGTAYEIELTWAGPSPTDAGRASYPVTLREG